MVKVLVITIIYFLFTAPNWIFWQSKPALPVITLEVNHYEFWNEEQKKMEHHEINPGIPVRVITDINKTKLVGVVGYMGHVCSFVIWNEHEKKYKKVEVELTGNVAKITKEVGVNYNPLQEFITLKKNWGKYIRQAVIPKPRLPGSPGLPVSPRSPGSPGSPFSAGHL